MTATAPAPHAEIERTEHPHVIKSQGVLGGQPRIDNQRIPVLMIFAMHLSGETTNEIVAGYPSLTPAEVHDAISYAYDHLDEMDYWTEQQKLRNVLRQSDMVYVNGRLLPRQGLDRVTLPEGVPVYTWETLPPELDE